MPRDSSAARSSRPVRTGKVARGETGFGIGYAPNAIARALQKPMNAAAAMRSITARTRVNIWRVSVGGAEALQRLIGVLYKVSVRMARMGGTERRGLYVQN